MKRIIDGKVYNTETATLIGEWGNNLSSSDFRNIFEGLYRTKKGAYFLAGSGGPMTRYSRRVGDMTAGGDNVFVLSELEARTWAEEHLSTEEYMEHFEVEEG